MPSDCPICGRPNPDIAMRCICGHSLAGPIAAKRAAFAPLEVLLDLTWIVSAIAGTSIAVWGIARASSEIHQEFLFLLVIMPWICTLSFLLRRHCYPNTRVWRAGSISPLDPIPAPAGRKLYVTFMGAVQVVLGMLLALVILSRTWHAQKVGAPKTSLVYDVMHPWSVAPLFEAPIDQPGNRAQARPPTQVPWWLLPGVGVVLSLIPLAWCGTLETNTRRNRMWVAQEMPPPEMSWARVSAILSLLLFWLPVIGLMTGILAYWLNRSSPTWTYRASQIGLLLAALLHAAVVAMILIEMMHG